MRSAVARLVNGRWGEPLGVAVVVVLVVAGSLAEAYPAHRYAGLHLRSHPDPATFALLAVPAALLLWRRSHPVAVYGTAVVGAAGWAATGQVYGAALVMVLVAFYSLAVAGSGRVALVAFGAGGTLAIWLAGGLRGPWGWWGGPQLDMWAEMVAAGAIGALVAARRHWKQSERLRLQQLDCARADEIRSQVTSERLRIARELHDVVAHSMAVINVQASAAAALLPSDPTRVAESLQAIRRASKEGLRELRSILDVLRLVDEEQPAVPLPDQEALQALADAAATAGTRTDMRCDAAFDGAPAETALAAYRIVQESLTNVIRHAKGASAEVTVARRGNVLTVDVVNDDQGSAELPVGGTGNGLVGMQERARALGGFLRAGPVPGGGFRVHAELPAVAAPPPDARPHVTASSAAKRRGS
jgi:signal transduction histidine kinase